MSINTDNIEIIESVKKLCLNEIPKYQTEKYYGTVPLPLFKSFSALGLTGLSISEEGGGIGGSASLIASILEEISKVDLGPAIFLSVHLMVSRIIQNFGDAAQKQRYLPLLADGKLLGAFALTEPSAGSDAKALKSTAIQSGGDFILNGSKTYITSAGWANLYIVFAKIPSTDQKDSSIAAFLVPADSKGLIVGTPEKKMGCELSPISTLTFEDIKLPKEALLGSLTSGYKIALSGLASGRVNIAACANGLSQAALERAVAHLNDREQFGKPLIEMQGLQFMLADMKTKLEAARLLTREAANHIDQHSPVETQRSFSSMAKLFATDSAMEITTDAVQLLGGAGYIREYQVERYMRDAKMLQIVEGTNQIQRGIIARDFLAVWVA